MITKLIVLLVIALACGAAFGQQVPIFRTVTIGDGRSISLGEDFTKISDLFEPGGDMYGLKKDLYGGADEIRVQVGDDRRIKAIHFLYDEKKAFKNSVKSYEASLGKRTGEEHQNLADLKIRRVVWEDSKTRFELIQRKQNGKASISSILIDK